jgi:hypothetical protein
MMMKTIRLLLAAALLALGGSSMAEEVLPSYMAPEKQRYGIIQELDFGANTMIFEGYRYRMAPELEVEIRGSYGAFTMLQPSMKALITYRVLSPSDREVVRIEQLPDNHAIDRF